MAFATGSSQAVVFYTACLDKPAAAALAASAELRPDGDFTTPGEAIAALSKQPSTPICVATSSQELLDQILVSELTSLCSLSLLVHAGGVEHSGLRFLKRVVLADLRSPAALADALNTAAASAEELFMDRVRLESYQQACGRLNAKESRVLLGICAGKLNKQLANDYGVSIRTIETWRRSVYQRFSVDSVAELAGKAAAAECIARYWGVPLTGHAPPLGGPHRSLTSAGAAGKAPRDK